MVLPGESGTPARDELRLLRSGRVRLSLEGDKQVLLRRPTLGQFKHLMERYEDLRSEYYDFDAPRVALPNGGSRPVVRDGVDINDLGGRWFSEVVALLAPVGTPPYDHEATPSWATSSALLFARFTQHWMEVPLVSDVEEEPEPLMMPMPLPPQPTMQPGSTEPQILKQVVIQ